jgi:hypothetical protein
VSLGEHLGAAASRTAPAAAVALLLSTHGYELTDRSDRISADSR